MRLGGENRSQNSNGSNSSPVDPVAPSSPSSSKEANHQAPTPPTPPTPATPPPVDTSSPESFFSSIPDFSLPSSTRASVPTSLADAKTQATGMAVSKATESLSAAAENHLGSTVPGAGDAINAALSAEGARDAVQGAGLAVGKGALATAVPGGAVAVKALDTVVDADTQKAIVGKALDETGAGKILDGFDENGGKDFVSGLRQGEIDTGALKGALSGALDGALDDDGPAGKARKHGRVAVAVGILGPFGFFVLFLALVLSVGAGLSFASSGVIEQESKNTVTANIQMEAGPSINNKASTGTKFSGDWKYYDQDAPNWPNWESAASIGDWRQSCGVVAAGMVLSSYSKDQQYDPNFVRGLCGTGCALSQSAVANFVNNNNSTFHLNATQLDFTVASDWNRMKTAVDGGGCALIWSASYSVAQSGIHWVVVRAFDGDSLVCADPWGGKEKIVPIADVRSAGAPGGSSMNLLLFEKA